MAERVEFGVMGNRGEAGPDVRLITEIPHKMRKSRSKADNIDGNAKILTKKVMTLLWLFSFVPNVVYFLILRSLL